MRKYIYADESGNFDFSNNPKATEYFILTTILIEDHSIAIDLADLRRRLAWEEFELKSGFHASEDRQYVRNAVFDVLSRHPFRVDATILQKRKAHPQLRTSEMRFYKYAWFYHMKFVAPRVVTARDELAIVAAAIGTNRKEAAFSAAIKDVMSRVSPTRHIKSTLWSAASDSCLQIADYCCWAIQRKWESNDDRSYGLIQNKIASEWELFKSGRKTYY